MGTTDCMGPAMHSLGIVERGHAVASLVVADEGVASRSPARLLITASTQEAVKAVARRIHEAGPRAPFPLLLTRARDLPLEPEALRAHCLGFLDAAAGGSVLISAVEEMPATVQDALIELLAGLEFAPGPSAEVRLISGTTVSLLDRVAAGTFSERLFYLLNVIHLMAGDGSPEAALM